MRKWGFWVLLAGVLIVGLVFGVIFTKPYTLRGSVIDPPINAPDFELDSSQGGKFQLSDYRGHFVILFFGYTFCPDVCPTTLYEMKQVKEKLQNESDQVTFVFITVDPERDSTQQLANYLQSFNNQFFGLSGPEADLEVVWNAYGVYREKQKLDSPIGYLIDHTSRLYLINPQGKLMMTYLFDTSVDEIVADLKYLIKNQ